MRHIALALSRKSNYLSFSTSYDVARRYALDGPYGQASASMPGYVYEIDLAQITGQTQSVVDPIAYIASGSNGSYAHEHDGSASLLLEVAQGLTSYTPAKHCGGSLLAPAVSLEFRAMVNAIRDAEILLMHSVPAGAIVDRHDEF
ncbi:MAG: hypothetical protein EOP71_03925 [Variovorax sp.]|nr:MAG: hypothetical protein EOP71_03925 [Variovorax sp.]